MVARKLEKTKMNIPSTTISKTTVANYVQETPSFQKNDLHDLKKAKKLLEKTGFAARITNALGSSIEKGLRALPNAWAATINKITQLALSKAIHAATFTMKDKPGRKASNGIHSLCVGISGAISGLFGLGALVIELPISTTIMLRSIADIARSEGEYIDTIESKIACMEVFALGGPKMSDNASESGYFVVRTALAQSVSSAAKYIAEKGLAKESAPVLVRLITGVAERFSIRVSAKTAAQAVPVIGSLGGAIINLIFIKHFQRVARGHFIIRRLERKYGEEEVKRKYNSIK